MYLGKKRITFLLFLLQIILTGLVKAYKSCKEMAKTNSILKSKYSWLISLLSWNQINITKSIFTFFFRWIAITSRYQMCLFLSPSGWKPFQKSVLVQRPVNPMRSHRKLQGSENMKSQGSPPNTLPQALLPAAWTLHFQQRGKKCRPWVKIQEPEWSQPSQEFKKQQWVQGQRDK